MTIAELDNMLQFTPDDSERSEMVSRLTYLAFKISPPTNEEDHYGNA